MSTGQRQRPIPLLIAAAVSSIEGAALAAYGIYVMVQVARLGITGPSPVSNVESVTLEIIIFLAFGAGLLVSGWGLWTARRWARAPAVLGQLLALVVGVPLVRAPGGVERGVGIALVALAVTALICLFVPSTTRAIVDD